MQGFHKPGLQFQRQFRPEVCGRTANTIFWRRCRGDGEHISVKINPGSSSREKNRRGRRGQIGKSREYKTCALQLVLFDITRSSHRLSLALLILPFFILDLLLQEISSWRTEAVEALGNCCCLCRKVRRMQRVAEVACHGGEDVLPQLRQFSFFCEDGGVSRIGIVSSVTIQSSCFGELWWCTILLQIHLLSSFISTVSIRCSNLGGLVPRCIRSSSLGWELGSAPANGSGERRSSPFLRRFGQASNGRHWHGCFIYHCYSLRL